MNNQSNEISIDELEKVSGGKIVQDVAVWPRALRLRSL
jgi:bacteriocin-like protein